MTSIRRIPTKHIEVGMYVSDATPGLDGTGLNKKGLISKQETVLKLQSSSIDELYIDVSKGKNSSYSAPVEFKEVVTEPTTELEEERARAEKVYGEARNLVGALINDIKMGKAIEVGPVEELGQDISDSLMSNSNALLCLSQIRAKDQYLLEHSINVGILMGVFSRYLGYDKKERHQMVTGAILHDLGKVRVPDHVLHKAGKLTDEEWQEMRKHVIYGEEVLLKSKGISDIAISICAQHHEKMNGLGYPRGLEGNEISVYGRMASIVDIYDAITADRVYHKGKSPNEAMKILSRLGRADLDKELVYKFIRCMSVYPIGTMVELSNQLFGVVIAVHTQLPDRPVVSVFFDNKQRGYVRPKLIDLSESENEQMSIARALDPNVLNMKVRNFI